MYIHVRCVTSKRRSLTVRSVRHGWTHVIHPDVEKMKTKSISCRHHLGHNLPVLRFPDLDRALSACRRESNNNTARPRLA